MAAAPLIVASWPTTRFPLCAALQTALLQPCWPLWAGPAVAECCTSCFPPPDQSFTGHTSPVESVVFNEPEECLAAGSKSGSIRVFDLSQHKGTLTFVCAML